MKAILIGSGLPSSCHRLTQLFESLPEQDQKKVIFESGVEEESFHENLLLVANAFVEWRYVYEHRGVKSISEQFLSMLWHAVETVAELKVSAQRHGGKSEA
jgi:hypothetical protein